MSHLFSMGGGLYSNLFPALLYSVSNSMGDSFVSFTVALITALTFAAYFVMGGKIENKNLPLFLLTLCLTFYFARIRLVPRPEMIAYLLQAIVMIIAMKADEGKYRFRIIVIILLLAFWRTVHVSWFFGLFFVLAYQCTENSSFYAFLRNIQRHKVALITMLSGGIVSLFLLRHVFQVFFRSLGKLMTINEMQPLWVFPEYFVPYSLIFLLFITLNFLLPSPAYKRCAVLLILYVMGAFIARNSAFFLFATLPHTIRTLTELSWPNQRLAPLVKHGCSLAILTIFVLIALDKDPEIGLGLNKQFTPLRSMEFIAKNLDQPVIFNDLDWGGHILWRSAGNITPFIDGRLAANLTKFDDYGKIINAQATRDNLKLYRIDTILTRGIYINSGRIYPLIFHLYSSNEWPLWNADDGLVFSNRSLTNHNKLNKRQIWEYMLHKIDHLEGLDGNPPHLLYSKGIALYMLGQMDPSKIAFNNALNQFPALRRNYAPYLRILGF